MCDLSLKQLYSTYDGDLQNKFYYTYKDGTLKTGSSSPSGYSYSSKITISGNSPQVFTLSGWGSKTAGHWSIGNYRFEIWYGDYCIGSKTFNII